MQIRKSTIPIMLDLIERRNGGEDVTKELEVLLSHEDYGVQFNFYNSHPAGIAFSRDDFIVMFNNIGEDSFETQASKALINRRETLLSVFEDVDFYKEKYELLMLISDDDLVRALDRTNQGLPEPLNVEEVELIVSIGVGVTGGFNRGNTNFFDFVKSFSAKTKEGFLNTVSHELHHKGFKEQFRIDYTDFRPVDAFIHFFAGEGLAIKFANNFQGRLTDKLYDGEHTHIKESYGYYMENFEAIINQFISDLSDIEGGRHDSVEALEALFDDHYYYRDVEIDGVRHDFYLKNPIAYYLGADIWGLLYNCLDRDVFFSLLQKPDGLYEVLQDNLKPIADQISIMIRNF